MQVITERSEVSQSAHGKNNNDSVSHKEEIKVLRKHSK